MAKVKDITVRVKVVATTVTQSMGDYHEKMGDIIDELQHTTYYDRFVDVIDTLRDLHEEYKT